MDTSLLQLLRRFWLLFLVGAIVAGGVAYVVARSMTPTYEASVQLLVGPINASFDQQRASGNVARTYADLATSGPVLVAAAKAAGVTAPLVDMRKDVTATSNDVTRILSIRARSGTAARSQAFAKALAQQLIRLGSESAASMIDDFVAAPAVTELSPEQQDAVRAAASSTFGALAPGRLRVVDPPERPTAAVAPKVGLITVLGAIAGALVAGIVAFVRASTSDDVESEQTLAGLEAVPFLGSVPRRVDGRAGVLAGDEGAATGLADRYRLVGAKIGLGASDVTTLLVVDADDGAGAGETAAHLASVLPEFGPRVTLVDASPSGEITQVLGLTGHDGYTDLVAQGSASSNGLPLDGYAVHHRNGLTVVPRGTQPATQQFDAVQARALLQRLRADGSVVLLHCPSIDHSPATLGWAKLADAAIVVVRRGKTSRAAVERTLSTLAMTRVNTVGTVLRA